MTTILIQTAAISTKASHHRQLLRLRAEGGVGFVQKTSIIQLQTRNMHQFQFPYSQDFHFLDVDEVSD